MNAPQTPGWDQLNEVSRRTYMQLLRFGAASRLDLSRALNLSPASLSRAAQPLVEAGLAFEADPRESDGGRPSIPLDLYLDAFSLIGVSATRSQVIAIATDARLGIRAQSSSPTKSLQPNKLLDQIAQQIQQVRSEITAQGLPVPLAATLCLGAKIQDGHTVLHAPFLEWENVPAAQSLRERTELPILLTHDLTSLAEAENWFGIGRTHNRFIVFTVGVGTGFAMVVDGKVITDENTDLGAMTPGILGTDWPNFMKLAPTQTRELDEAAQKLGKLIGTAAAFTMPQAVILTGEGSPLLAQHQAALQEGIDQVRHPLASKIPLQILPHDHALWARGAAATAVQWALRQRT